MPKKVTKKAAPAEVLYPEVTVDLYCAPSPGHQGSQPLTAARAMQLLGWETEPEDKPKEGGGAPAPNIKFGQDYAIKDANDCKVRLHNNTHNRPFNSTWASTLAQDILNKRWAFNGETIIVGRSGQILSGQHRLVGLVLAVQIWAGPQKHHWQEIWETEPTLDTIVVYGVEESSTVTRTLDNVRPRTLADVLFTEPAFARIKGDERRVVCRMIDYAVKMLWSRTGAVNDAFAPRRTHSEALDFIQRHPRLAKAVVHIHEENGEKAISALLSPGYAAAYLYLMAASGADGDAYRNMDAPAEGTGKKALNFRYWDRACDFWAMLAGGAHELRAVREALSIIHGEDGNHAPTLAEKTAVLVKAWEAFKDGGTPTLADLRLRYGDPDGDGYRPLLDHPSFGGLDATEGGIEEVPAAETARHASEAEEPADDQEPLSPGEEAILEDEQTAGDTLDEEALARAADATQPVGPGPHDPTPEEIEARAEEARRLREEKRERLLANRRGRQGG